MASYESYSEKRLKELLSSKSKKLLELEEKMERDPIHEDYDKWLERAKTLEGDMHLIELALMRK